jgi:predicted transposase YdaD
MVLTTVEEEQAPEEARYLLTRTRQELSQEAGRAIIDLVTTIIAYRFEKLSRMEVESMLDIKLKETRVYREIKEEGREEEAVNLIIRQLNKRFGKVSDEIRSSIFGLPLPVLEDLSEALLDFTSLANLQSWIETRIK